MLNLVARSHIVSACILSVIVFIPGFFWDTKPIMDQCREQLHQIITLQKKLSLIEKSSNKKNPITVEKYNVIEDVLHVAQQSGLSMQSANAKIPQNILLDNDHTFIHLVGEGDLLQLMGFLNALSFLPVAIYLDDFLLAIQKFADRLSAQYVIIRRYKNNARYLEANDIHNSFFITSQKMRSTKQIIYFQAM